MAAHRAPGMDHDLYDYRPMPERRPLAWPEGKRLALWVLLHLEYWELNAPEGAARDSRFKGEFGNYYPDYRTWCTREYGNRIGIYRILEILDRFGIVPTVAVNAMACARYPSLVQELRDRNVDVVCHGEAVTRMVTSRMDETAERALIDQATKTVGDCFGKTPQGWLSQDFGATPRTMSLLAEAGYTHVLDWPNDEQPYFTKVGDPPLVALPHPHELDDQHLLLLQRVQGWRYPDLVEEATMHLAGEGGRVLGLSLHPWVIGTAHRIGYLEEGLSRVMTMRGIWRATASDIVSRFITESV